MIPNHPRDLVKEYGAKAGLLQYIAEQLPEIPQMPMLVKRPTDPLEKFVQEVRARKWGSRLLIRSSAEVELYGFEGAFSTIPTSTRELLLTETIKQVMNSSQRVIARLPPWNACYREHIPQCIAVIATPISSSKYTGTFIKHPNQDDFYIVSLTATDSKGTRDPKRGQFIIKKGNVREASILQEVKTPRNIKAKDLAALVSIHERIARLPSMDPTWTWQIEFGLNPFFLYQVRPFKPVEIASFALDPWVKFKAYECETIPIGVTSPAGIRCKVIKDLQKKFYENTLINPENDPVAHMSKLREMHWQNRIPNVCAALSERLEGCLAHTDIAAIKRADLSAYNAPGAYNKNREYLSFEDLRDGDWIRLTSDGKTLYAERD